MINIPFLGGGVDKNHPFFRIDTCDVATAVGYIRIDVIRNVFDIHFSPFLFEDVLKTTSYNLNFARVGDFHMQGN